MALWTNTADGWGSDPSSSGNGALASYLQSSNASAPQSNSQAQVSDPSTSTPTSSIARAVQPSVSKLAYGVSGGLATQPAALSQYTAQPLATALTATPQGVSRFSANIAAPASSFTQPAAVSNAVNYSGPTTQVGYVNTGKGYANSQYSVWNPATQQFQLAGAWDSRTGNFIKADGTTLTGQDATNYVMQLQKGKQQFANTGDALQNAIAAGTNSAAYANNAYGSQIQAFQNGQTAATSTNIANLSAAQNSSSVNDYLAYMTANGGALPPRNSLDNSLGGQDNAARAAASAQYQANQASASAISQGIAPVDTSTQDAANNAALAAVSSRYSTNLMGSNIGAMGRLYAAAIPTQAGVNQQLSNEDYAARFDQNMQTFSQAVNNQAQLDSNATGVKLQSDITAIGDAVTKLNQQVSQLGTTAGQAVSGSLLGLQQQLNKYHLAVQQLGADNSTTIALAKGVIGLAASVGALAA